MSTTTNGRRYSTGSRQEPGWALKRCAPMQKHISQALGMDASWVSRQVRGIRDGAVRKFFEHCADLMKHRKCHAGPLIGEALVVMQDALEPFADDELEDLFRNAMQEEVKAQAQEDLATNEVYWWLERTKRPDARPEDMEKLSWALEEMQDAVANEVGWEITKRVIGKEMQRRVNPRSFNGSNR